MKTYHGINTGIGGQKITVFEGTKTYSLPHIYRHSPDGFQWGYGGSGPADTALSVLTDCVGEEKANKYYQDFKNAFIAGVVNELYIKENQILNWLKKEVKKNESRN